MKTGDTSRRAASRTTGGRRGRKPVGGASGSFGDLLRHLRETAGLTQEELAERAQLGERSIRALERDESSTPRLQTVRLLAQGLGLDPDGRARLIAKARPPTRGDEQTPDTHQFAHFVTPLVGREDEVQVVKLMLEERRLLTLTGTGGVGKTRLALEVGRQLESAFDRVVIVDLAPLRHGEQVVGAIAGQLGITEQARKALVDVVVSMVQSTRMLLILDNFEHLMDARPDVLTLLRATANLCILVTSREPLHLRGERIYTVGPLPLPGRDPDPMRSPAVRLFVERAADTGIPLRLDKAQASAVAEICRRLDGLPLALELAAAWTPIFVPESLLSRLATGLMEVDHAPTDQPARQRTMKATMKWSYDLLTPDEQALLARLSVFSGGFTCESADALCGAVGPLDLNTLQGLASLRDKSLVNVQPTPRATEPRFGMLETVREFANAQLVDRGEAERAQFEHTRYFLDLAEEPSRKRSGAEQAQWLIRLDTEHDNLRAALDAARRSGDVNTVFRLVVAMWPFWFARNHFDEAQEWLDLLLDIPDSSHVAPFLRAQVLLDSAMLVGLKGDSDGAYDGAYDGAHEVYVSRMGEALVLARQAGLEACAAEALHFLGFAEGSRGQYAVATPLLEESLELYRRLDDSAGLSRVLSSRAGLARYQGDFDQAERSYDEALALSRVAGDRKREAGILARIGNMRTEQGRPEESSEFYDEGLLLARELGDRFAIADVLERQGETATACGEFERAMTLYAESLDLYRALGTQYGEAYVLLNQSEAALGLGDLTQARCLAFESRRLFESIGDRRSVGFALMHMADVAAREGDIPEALGLYGKSLARHRDLNTRPQIARCLERLASLAVLQGHDERSAILHGAATGLRLAMSSSMTPAEQSWYMPAIDRAREALGPDQFIAQENDGRSMTLTAAIGYALDGELT